MAMPSKSKLNAIAPQARPIPAIDNITLNHLHLRVDDLDRAQEFYERDFGWEPATEIAVDQRQMRFLRDKKGFLLVLEKHPDTSPIPEWFHLGFELPSKDELLEAANFFKKEGTEFIADYEDFGEYASFTITDPDGYHIQVYWQTPNWEKT